MASQKVVFAGWSPTLGQATEAEIDHEALSHLIPSGTMRTTRSGGLEATDPLRSAIQQVQTSISQLPKKAVFRRGVPTLDPEDPSVGKWAVIVLQQDFEQAHKALEPLIQRRIDQGIAYLGKPGFSGAPGIVSMRRPASHNSDRWVRSLAEATRGNPPHYLLLVGGPDRFPFEVQYALDQLHITGRLDVGDPISKELSWRACQVYAEKLVRYEKGKIPVSPRALLYSFSTDAATRQSHQELSIALHEHLSSPQVLRKLKTRIDQSDCLFDNDATTARLCTALHETRPALVVTSSHGIEFPSDRLLWGALTDSTFVGKSGIPLSANSISTDKSFAEGAVVLVFACFGAGVPQKSAHQYWMQQTDLEIADAPFTSPLPRALLAHQNGPIAFVGHVDRSTSYSFYPQGSRPGPVAFLDFADWFLGGFGTLGQAMSTFRERYGLAATQLGEILNAVSKRPNARPASAIADAWIRYHDAAGYILLGDPVLRIATS